MTRQRWLCMALATVCVLGAASAGAQDLEYFGEHTAEVAELDAAITIDGVAEAAWDDIDWLRASDAWNATRPDNETDFSARFKTAYFGSSMYLLVEVTDDVIDTSGDDEWAKDNVEVLVNGPSANEVTSGDDNVHLSNWEAAGGPTQFRFIADGVTKNFGNGVLAVPDEAAIFALNTDTPGILLYEIELIAPGEIPPGEFGFLLHIVDNDAGAYKTSIAWAGGEQQDVNVYNDNGSLQPWVDVIWARAYFMRAYPITMVGLSDPPGLTLPPAAVMDGDIAEVNHGNEVGHSFWVRSSISDGGEIYQAYLATTDLYNLDSEGGGGPDYADGGDPLCYPRVVVTNASLRKGNTTWPAANHFDWYQMHSPTGDVTITYTYKAIDIPVTYDGGNGVSGPAVVHHNVTGHSIDLTVNPAVTNLAASNGTLTDNGDGTWTLSGVTEFGGVTVSYDSPWGAESSPFIGDADLVIYYPFDQVTGGVVLDQSGKGNDGVVNGNVTFEAAGMRGGAGLFADSGFLDLDGPNFPAGDIPTSGFTLAAWCNVTDTGGNHALLNSRATDDTFIQHLEIRPTDYRCQLRAAGSTSLADIRTGTSVLGDWVHYAATYDQATGKVTLYIDGQVLAQEDAAVNEPLAGDWGQGARVGYNVDDARPFTGLMDEFYVFKRALSASEITNLYELQAPVDPEDDTDGDGLPDWWETANGLDPNDATGINGALGDPDGDGWTNIEEFERGTDPWHPDPRPIPVAGPLVLLALALALAGLFAGKLAYQKR
jgi:hypothetical protein